MDEGEALRLDAFHAAGPLVLRGRLHSHAHRLAAVSETLSYEVAEAQNPALTISASPESLAFGESVTVSGTLAGPAGVDGHTGGAQRRRRLQRGDEHDDDRRRG